MKLSDIIRRLGAEPEDAIFQGNGWAIVCPAHDDHEPSLRVAITRESNLLLKCRAGCDTSDVLAAGGFTFPEVQPVEEDLGRAARVHDTGEPVALVEQATMAAYVHAVAEYRLPTDALEYLDRRFGVDESLAVTLGIGFDDGSAPYSRLARTYHEVPRLVVPFRDFEGVPRGFQGRALEDHKVRWQGPSNPETGSWAAYGFFEAQGDMEYVLVTEGPGDALAACAAGFDAVGIRGASLAGRVVPEIIANLRDRPVVLAGDNDDAGRAFNASLAAPLIEAGLTVYELALPHGIKDLGAWYEADGDFAISLQTAVAAAGDPRVAAVLEQDREDAQERQRALQQERSAQRYTTEQGLATILQERLGDHLMHSPGLGFFLYRQGAWERDTLDRVRLMAHEVARQLYEEAEAYVPEHEEDTFAQKLFNGARKLRSTRVLDQVLQELAAITNVDPDTFDQKRHLLVVANGTIDLRTGELGEHSPEHLITHRLDIEYDPEATAPRWESFLREIMPTATDEMAAFLRRLVGYGVTGYTSEQAFAVLWGSGANGKSVFTDTLARVFEPITQTTPFSTFEKKLSGGIPNDLAALRGSRLVMASEGGAGNAMAEDVIKRVTGQDLVTARFMRAEFFSFRPTFLILLATNHKPAFRGQDEGLWRRVKLIPFNRYFSPEERDHRLTEKLVAEAQGILAWAVRGASEWSSEGLQEPALVSQATEGYREVMDALAGFYPGVLEHDAQASIRGAEAYALYREWCFEEGVADKNVWSNKAFFAAMEERGVMRTKKKDGIHLEGVRRRTEECPPGHKVASDHENGIFR